VNPVPGLPPRQGLYDPSREHDACGVGFVAHIKGRKSHDIVEKGLTILNNLRTAGRRAPIRCTATARACSSRSRRVLPRGDGRAGREAAEGGAYGVGMVFLPRNPRARRPVREEVERAIVNEGR
jgi:glutamate synthase (NADPH/NADH) large chain